MYNICMRESILCNNIICENVNKHIENTLYVVNTSMRIQIDMKGFFGGL